MQRICETDDVLARLQLPYTATCFKYKADRDNAGRTNRFGFPTEQNAAKIVVEVYDDSITSMDTPSFLRPLDVPTDTAASASATSGGVMSSLNIPDEVSSCQMGTASEDVSFMTPRKADVMAGDSTPSAPFVTRGNDDGFEKRRRIIAEHHDDIA